MKKKMIALTMVMVMVLLASCGKEIPVTESTSDSVKYNDNIAETEKTEEATENTEDEVLTNLDAVEESDEANLNLKEYKYSFEDRKVAEEGDSVFYLADFEDDTQYLKLKDSVKIYAFNGKCIGYTKEGIEINTIGRYGDWYYLMIDRDYRFVKVAEVDATATDMSVEEEVPAPVETEVQTPKQDNETVSVPSEGDATVTAPVEEETPVQDTGKYTPEEAIAVYRGIMEGGGIIWDPSLKDVSSWGTGFFYLDKDYIEWAGATNLESCAYGDGVGNPFTRYYLEVTGSDDNTVYFTEWHN